MSLDPTHVPTVTAPSGLVVALAERGPEQPRARRWPAPAAADCAGAHEHRLQVLTEVIRRTAPMDLPGVSRWQEQSTYSGRDRVDTVHGDLDLAASADVARRRDGVRAWARALGGTVVERASARSIECSARALMAGVQVSVRAFLWPDGRCADCGGPAVGALVLSHADDCPSASLPDRACGCSSRFDRHADGCKLAKTGGAR